MSRVLTREQWERETKEIVKEMLREGLVLRVQNDHRGDPFVELWLEGELLTKAELPSTWEDD